MRMRMIALLALLALPPGSALAQESNAPPQQSPALPLAAMRHQQPREDTVHELESAREGQEKVDQQSKQQQTEIDQLYREIMQRSAASGGK